jgi:predicted restriction endonuclease
LALAFFERNNPNYLVTLEGSRITNPIDEKYLPDIDALKWHRQEIFRKR